MRTNCGNKQKFVLLNEAHPHSASLKFANPVSRNGFHTLPVLNRGYLQIYQYTEKSRHDIKPRVSLKTVLTKVSGSPKPRAAFCVLAVTLLPSPCFFILTKGKNMTVRSMTGFAHACTEAAGKRIDLEIRSVNHRFLDVQFKIPDDLRALESSMREAIAAQVSRGKIEIRIQLNHTADTSGSLNINQALVGELAHLNSKLRKKHPDLAKMGVAELLRFPGVITSTQTDSEALSGCITNLLDTALKDFVGAREREGAKLQAHIIERLDLMEAIVGALEELFPNLLQAHITRSRNRLAEAVAHVDEDRLKQEFALFMQKADVDEEFNRLRTHIAEVRRIVTEHKGSIGKRLDFLMQELNREANTLGSKAIASECTQVSVELKVLIEQMREQVQNIE